MWKEEKQKMINTEDNKGLKPYRATVDTMGVKTGITNFRSINILNRENRSGSEYFKAISYNKTKTSLEEGKIHIVVKVHNIFRTSEQEFYVESFTETKEIMKNLYIELGVEEVKDIVIDRVDIAIDRPESFKACLKEIRYLYHLLTLDFADKDLWYNTTFRKGKVNTFMAKGRDFELSFYDKELESNGAFEYKTRLEFRFKRLKGNDLEKVINKLLNKLNNLDENIPEVEQQMIELLCEKYDSEDNPSFTLSEFARNEDSLIYNNNIMKALYKYSGLKGNYNKWLEKCRENIRKREKNPNMLRFVSDSAIKKQIKGCQKALKEYRKS